jgi:peroxiredoxin
LPGFRPNRPTCSGGLVERLGLPFPLLSDADLALTRALDLATFTVAGHTLLKRLTMVIRAGAIEHVFYPVFPPDIHAQAVLEWVLAHPVKRLGVNRAPRRTR